MASAGKVFTQPLLVLLLIAIVCWIASSRREGRGTGKRAGFLRTAGMSSLIILWLLSLPAMAVLLESTLLLAPVEPPERVEAVVVLAGGLARSQDPSFLSSDSALRVLDGVGWWKRFPGATLVMSGDSNDAPDKDTTPMTELMRDFAIEKGVPPERIALEDRSRNTREHPLEVLRIPGIDRTTRIGVATSRWHLRRASIEFRKHFDVVVPLPRPPTSDSRRWSAWIPSANALEASTTMIHEWLGIAWYRILSL